MNSTLTENFHRQKVIRHRRKWQKSRNKSRDWNVVSINCSRKSSPRYLNYFLSRNARNPSYKYLPCVCAPPSTVLKKGTQNSFLVPPPATLLNNADCRNKIGRSGPNNTLQKVPRAERNSNINVNLVGVLAWNAFVLPLARSPGW